MPIVNFEAGNKKQDSSDFPRLKLEMNDRARILCIEPAPFMEYAHTFRAPKVVNGEVVMRQIKRKDGTTFEDYEMDFLGMPICLGDVDALQDKGVDPKGCPACASSVIGEDVAPPVRRFAMHVLRYACKPGSTAISEPFSVSTVVWRFTDSIFNKLTDLKDEHGDLRRHDLLLGPCENALFQKFEINISAKAEWLVTPERKQFAVETYRNNQAEDLTTFCGRVSDRKDMEESLHRVSSRWDLVRGISSDGDSSSSGDVLTEGLESLLNQSTATKVVAPEARPALAKEPKVVIEPAIVTPVEAATAEVKPTELESPVEVVQPNAPVEKTASEKPDTKAISFDDLLASLDG